MTNFILVLAVRIFFDILTQARPHINAQTHTHTDTTHTLTHTGKGHFLQR